MSTRGLASGLTALLVLLGAGAAHGELAQSGHLRLSFRGGFAPRALPRHRLVPVRVRLSGSIRSTNAAPPPRLRQVSFAVNRHSRLFIRGLPACPIGALLDTTSRTALERCAPAWVGEGSIAAKLAFPGRPRIPVRGRLLVFNGRSGGRPVFLLHLYVSTPAQVTMVVPLKIRRRRSGDFGTVFTARIPVIAGDTGYVTHIDLSVGRRFRFRGRPESLFSAGCPAPAGFPGAVFKLARGSFSFSNGQHLAMTLTSNCQVRRSRGG